MNLAIIGYGLTRGREPELSLLSDSHNVRIIGYRKKGKMHESGIGSSSGLQFVYPKIHPVLFADPIFAFRNEYDCSSWIRFENLEKYLQDADLMIAHELWNFFSYQSVKISKRLGIPSVVIVFETIPRNFAFTFIPPYSRNTRYVKKNANLFIAQTNRARSYLQSLSIRDERIKVVYPGIDLELFRPSSIKENRDEIRILFVGNFIQKGLPILLDVFMKLSKKHSHVRLWIAGNGPEDMIHRIKLLETKFPLKFFGTVSHKDIAKIYRNADIFCTLNRDMTKLGVKTLEEQFGYALVEAMGAGLPIVTTNCGAIPEIISQKNFLVDQDHREGLEDALEALFSDGGLRRTIGIDNRKRAETLFDAKKQCAILTNHISALTN